jgi:serine phosphatase RsbU (regulator of sigma subunit)
MAMRAFVVLASLFIVYSVNAQNRELDSIAAATAAMSPDTNKVNALSELAWSQIAAGDCNAAIESGEAGVELALKLNFYRGAGSCYGMIAMAEFTKFDYHQSILTTEKAREAYEKAKSVKGICWAHDNMAHCYYQLGDNGKALGHALQCLEVRRELNDTSLIAISCNSVGNAYQETGDFVNALQVLMEGKKLYEYLEDTMGIATSCLNIGIVYYKQDLDSIALEFYDQALEGYRSVGAYGKSASVLVNMGNVHHARAEHDLALTYFRNAMEIYTAVGNVQRTGFCTQNIGNIHWDKGNVDSALWYYEQSYQTFRNAGDLKYTAGSAISIAQVKFAQAKYGEAQKLGEEGLTLAKEARSREDIADAYLILSKVYSKQNNYQKAYDYHVNYALTHDSLFNESSAKMLSEIRTQYETAKKDNEIRMLNDSAALQQAVIDKQTVTAERQAVVRNSFVIGFILVAGLAFFIFRSYREKKKANEIITQQKSEVEQQKEIIEEKNKDILDSITYAKRLQEAILPQVKQITDRLPGSFLLYQPKDIVAGDFYFMEAIGHKTIIAAADCTGHGVPGAMVSVVCSNALSRAVKEFSLIDPGKILDKVTELVVETFAKSSSEVQDGMDISLAVIDESSSRVQWAGAHNPLWYFSEGAMHEITADKQPIGRSDRRRNFTTHELNLQKGDRLYLFTDGYADQFGGPNGKKFKYKPFKELLESISKDPADDQREVLASVFREWRGKLEQVDDVCVLSIRV